MKCVLESVDVRLVEYAVQKKAGVCMTRALRLG